MKTELLKTIAKSTFALIAALAVFAATRPSGNVQAVVDSPSLYAEIAGGYEFYLGLQYMVISISLDQGKLWGRAPGDPKAQELQPVDIAGLKFKINDPGREQYAVFFRNSDGRISACRLIMGDTESVGEKIPAGGRARRPAETTNRV